jgi:hypothetical protein
MPHASCTMGGRICPLQKPIRQPLPGLRGPGPGTPLLLSTYQTVVNPARTTCGDRVKTTAARQDPLGWCQQTLALNIQVGIPARAEKPDRAQLKQLCRRSRRRPIGRSLRGVLLGLGADGDCQILGER